MLWINTKIMKNFWKTKISNSAIFYFRNSILLLLKFEMFRFTDMIWIYIFYWLLWYGFNGYIRYIWIIWVKSSKTFHLNFKLHKIIFWLKMNHIYTIYFFFSQTYLNYFLIWFFFRLGTRINNWLVIRSKVNLFQLIPDALRLRGVCLLINSGCRSVVYGRIR